MRLGPQKGVHNIGRRKDGAAVGQSIQLGSDDVRRSVKADIRVSKIVRENEQDVGTWCFRRELPEQGEEATNTGEYVSRNWIHESCRMCTE